MGMMDRRKQVIKKSNNRGILLVENYHGKINFSAANAALEAQKIPIISTGVRG